MPAKLDLTGQTWGRLTILAERDRTKHGAIRWLCRCACGNERVVVTASLVGRKTESCGCLQRELNTKHGMTLTREYATWQSMMSRCTNANHVSFANYGGRGINVCDRWLDSVNFLADMGKRPSAKHSLDRIDNNGNYDPDNCRWATKTEQTTNRRLHRTSKSGAKGVRWAPDQQKWVAFITLGSFDSKDDAIQARLDADKALAALATTKQTGAAA